VRVQKQQIHLETRTPPERLGRPGVGELWGRGLPLGGGVVCGCVGILVFIFWVGLCLFFL